MMLAEDLTVTYCDVTTNLNVVEICGGEKNQSMALITTMVNSKCCVEHAKMKKKRVVLGVLCNLAVTHASKCKKTRKWEWEPILLEGSDKTE